MTTTVTITDGHIDGYLTLSEYGEKYDIDFQVLRSRMYRKSKSLPEILRIGRAIFIKDEPLLYNKMGRPYGTRNAPAEHIDGYLTVKEYSEKYEIKVNTIQQRLCRGTVDGALLIHGRYYLRDVGKDMNKTSIPLGYISVRQWAEKNGIDVFLAGSWITRNTIEYIQIDGRNYIKETEPIPERKYGPKYTKAGYLTVKEYAEKHGVGKHIVNYWIRRGKLDYIVNNNRCFFIKEDEPVPEKSTRQGRPRKSDIINRFFELRTSHSLQAT